MEMLRQLAGLFLHIDDHLREVISQYGGWTYAILFIIIFCETGLVVTPFLPGDSLLFAAGTFAAQGSLNVWALSGLLIAAAILGDCVNYMIGNFIGPRVFRYEGGWLLRKEHLEKTKRVFERYGAKAIVIARFLPIVRTFAPFLAGVGDMTYLRFLSYNVIGGCVWVLSFVFAGYWFGGMKIVKDNFEIVVLAIIAISVLPMVIEFAQTYFPRKQVETADSPLNLGEGKSPADINVNS